MELFLEHLVQNILRLSGQEKPKAENRKLSFKSFKMAVAQRGPGGGGGANL